MKWGDSLFDPTAFDNMKVVLEGAIYDKDLAGEIVVVDRNDFINIAKMSRIYEMTFTIPTQSYSQCTITLEATLEQLASEILKMKKDFGSFIEMKFIVEHSNNDEMITEINQELVSIWGSDREFKQIIKWDPFSQNDIIQDEIIVRFNRIVTEEQMEDFPAMIDYMIESLKKLNEIVN